jgi:hypothetical protein
MLEIEEDTQYGLAKEAIVDAIEVNDNIVIVATLLWPSVGVKPNTWKK